MFTNGSNTHREENDEENEAKEEEMYSPNQCVYKVLMIVKWYVCSLSKCVYGCMCKI